MTAVNRLAATFCAIACISSWAAGEPLSGEALYRDVVRYDQIGNHRTGTPGDQATSKWVAEELKKAGFEVRLDPYTLRQYMLQEASLIVDGNRIDCFPFWYPHDTGDAPVKARLAHLVEGARSNVLRGRIAYTEAPERNWRLDIRDMVEKAVRAGAVGLVVMIPGPSGEPLAQNAPAPHNQEPHAIPALIVGQKSAALLRNAARDRAPVQLAIRGRDLPEAESSNVVAKLVRGDKWIVVTTPLSGWFTCAGERGPGVALFLGLARWAAARDGEHSLLFLGNTGHELDQVGAHQTLEKIAPPPEDVSLWIHLGASITAREYEKKNGRFRPLEKIHADGNLVGTKALGPLLEKAFANVDGLQPRTEGPVHGELRQFMDAGYNAYGFFGSFLYFHTTLDTGAVTSPELLEPVGAAIVQTIEALD